MCKLGVMSQERSKTEVKLLLSVNRKSYAASISTTTDDLDDLEWPSHGSSVLSVWEECAL